LVNYIILKCPLLFGNTSFYESNIIPSVPLSDRQLWQSDDWFMSVSQIK